MCLSVMVSLFLIRETLLRSVFGFLLPDLLIVLQVSINGVLCLSRFGYMVSLSRFVHIFVSLDVFIVVTFPPCRFSQCAMVFRVFV